MCPLQSWRGTWIQLPPLLPIIFIAVLDNDEYDSEDETSKDHTEETAEENKVQTVSDILPCYVAPFFLLLPFFIHSCVRASFCDDLSGVAWRSVGIFSISAGRSRTVISLERRGSKVEVSNFVKVRRRLLFVLGFNECGCHGSKAARSHNGLFLGQTQQPLQSSFLPVASYASSKARPPFPDGPFAAFMTMVKPQHDQREHDGERGARGEGAEEDDVKREVQGGVGKLVQHDGQGHDESQEHGDAQRHLVA